MAEPVGFDPSTAKLDFDPTTARAETGGDVPRAGMAGINAGIASILGLPVDTAENAINLAKAGFGSLMTAAGKPDLAPELTRGTVGGSRWISDLMQKLGVNTENPAPNDPASQIAFRAGSIAPTAMLPGASVGQTALAAGGAAIGERLGGHTGAMLGAMVPAAASTGYAAARGPTLAARQIANEQRDATAAAARAEGLTLSPTETNPTNLANRALEGYAGKLTTRQDASAANAPVAVAAAKRSLGIPANQQLDVQRLEAIRDSAGQVYDQVKNFRGSSGNGRIIADAAYTRAVQGITSDRAAAIAEFPGIVANPDIAALQTALNVPSMTPRAAVELVKDLRSRASDNLNGNATPQSIAVGRVQRQAANIVDGLVERDLVRAGNKDLYDRFRDARTQIARSYDIQSALNPATGSIDAAVLAKLDRKTQPLGPDLERIARTQEAFEKNMQRPEQIGARPGLSPLDFVSMGLLGTTGAAVGGPLGGGAAMLGPLLRPGIRSLLLSGPYQRTLGVPSYDPMLTPDSGLAALLRGNVAGNMTQ